MKKESNFFKDSIAIFLSYITRMMKEDSDYKPHPLISAFEMALQGLHKAKEGECIAGVSGNQSGHGNLLNPYLVVLFKDKDDGIIIKTITDVATNKELPTDFMVTIFRLQIRLDKYPGDEVNATDAARILNDVIPGAHFYALGERWTEARDKFIDLVENGNMKIPSDKAIISELKELKKNTAWEDYSPQLRGLIGGTLAEEFDKRSGIIVLTNPINIELSKIKLFEMVGQIFLGETSRFLAGDPNECILCNFNKFKDQILMPQDYFVLLADKFPLISGHLLISTKHHVRASGDLLEDQLAELDEIFSLIADFYDTTYDLKDYTFFESGFIGQSIHHAHIHVIPGNYHLLDALKSVGFTEITELKDVREIANYYKNNGGYFVWKEGAKIYATYNKDHERKIKPSMLRSIIAGELLNSTGIDWIACSKDNGCLKTSKLLVDKLKKDWQSYLTS
jgi:diadenosine tetraphosphate (Ap4A) HIT family hydrolase